MEPREIRDPVHGFIRLDATDCQLADTKPVQRLRRIHQLALASALYPGATHTRFEHSLGVLHVASAMCDRLGIDGDRKRLIQQAALLHDVGHGPFSHVSEIPLARYSDPQAFDADDLGTEEAHEEVTARIIERHPELERVLSRNRRSDIAKLIRGTYDDPIAKAIISGPLDADKQDYLLRDSQMCGVQYGVFDLDRLQQSLTIVRDAEGQESLAVERDSVHAVEQFLMAKHYITSQVYAHRVRLITDQMLIRAIVLGVEEDGIDELRELYTYDASDAFVQRYTEWDDYRFLTRFADDSVSPGYCAKMLNALQCRRLHKQVFEAELTKFAEQAPVLFEPADETRKRIEERAAQAISCQANQEIDPLEVICYTYRRKSVRPSTGDDMSAMLVTTDGHPIPFDQASAFYQSMEAMRSDTHITIFAPVQYNTQAERSHLERAVKEPLYDAIFDAAAHIAGEEWTE